MSISKEQRDKDPHAGPGDSFPLDREHLHSAWDLSGHAADPSAVRRNIIAFAKRHGMTDLLPATAHEWNKGMAKKAFDLLQLAVAFKAKTSDVESLLQLSWEHESMEGDTPEKRQLVRWAHDHGMSHLLPGDSHSLMHDMGIPHNHEGVANDDNGMHTHLVSKAMVSESTVQKAWEADGKTYIEGWISTPERDLQGDIVEPEAFIPSMDRYFRVGAPLSSEHNIRKLPVGHVQKAAVVRDGNILKSANHPDEPNVEFEHFPATGSGIWGRAVITEAETGTAIKAGNVRGFSWIGDPVKKTPLPGKGSVFHEVNPWNETTVAAYPINQGAAVMAVKAGSDRAKE